ncbi:DUF6576 domain-containing protein [Candidatus Poriferisocius sp.]|uniref:DUF6576 domain-containing protein n=1 Tax=Candidatus Poriferisocius sp. TaxID=3101276 RepID=UPI003B5BC730
MYPSRRFGYSDDPWFRIGGFAVSTTAFVVGLGVLSMIIWGIEGRYGPIFQHLALVSENFEFGSVLEGEIWRLVTWPIPNEPTFWTIILFAIFYMLGSQLEMLLGRVRFAWFLVLLTVIPAAMVTGLEAVAGITGGAAGLRLVEVGVLVAFAAQYAHARFWPGIPGWVIAVVIVGLDALQALSTRDEYELVLLACTVAVALLGIRAFGFAVEQTWIPKLTLSSDPSRSSTGPRGARADRRSRRGGHLRAVPPPNDEVSPEIDALLDQVAGQGLDSLSRKQRKQLEAHARRLRKRR